MSLPAGQPQPGGAESASAGGLQARVAELERRNAELRVSAAVTAHELMAPLIAVEGHAKLLYERLREPLDEQAREDLEAVLRGTTRMRVVLDLLLQQARSRAPELQRTRVKLGEIAEECVAMLRPQISARGGRVIVTPMPTVNADPRLIASVLANLMLNGLHYGPREGGVTRVSAARGDGEWRIAVESDGRPIEAADRSRIFEAFERGHGERRAHGAGLGLAICRTIVEQHGGAIGVEPLERGNRFFFTLRD